MKKGIIILIVIFLSSFWIPMKSQDKKSEFTIGYGIPTTVEFINTFSNLILSGLSYNTLMTNTQYSGAIHLDYKYAISNRIAIGGTFVYENSSADISSGNELLGKVYTDYYTVAAEMDFKYIKRKNFSFYGLVGAGASMFSQRYNKNDSPRLANATTCFNFQLTPIGLKFGNKIGGFIEAGFGYKGIVTAGIFGRF